MACSLARIAFGGLLAVVLVGLSLSGSMIDSQDQGEPASDEEGFVFEWFPDEPDFAYLVSINTQGDTNCAGSHTISGSLTHESGIGSYEFTSRDEGSTSSTSSSRADDSVHAGPANTAHITGPAVGQFGSFSTSWSTSTLSGWAYTVQAAFSTTEPREPLRIACDGPDASLRFYRADALEPIVSSSSRGGAGVEAWTIPSLPATVGANIADRYTIGTAGDFVFVRVSDEAMPGESSIEGEIRMRTPLGEENVTLEPHEGHYGVDIMRTWSEPGTYQVEFDRLAENRKPLVGILGGFVLEEQVGALAR